MVDGPVSLQHMRRRASGLTKIGYSLNGQANVTVLDVVPKIQMTLTVAVHA